MKDRETILLERWRADLPMYSAWGDFVCQRLSAAIEQAIAPSNLQVFLRMPLKQRTKDEGSLLAKAFHRGKGYSDPYKDIDDKVGLRIVVLFSDEIRLVENAILACENWGAQKSRDFEDERAAKPFEFDYQSLHYIVRAKAGIKHGEIAIETDTPCEIQVRTILQHAYSELTHDTIYKPSIQAEPDVKRAAAKSMALIEATDDYFAQVQAKLAQIQAPGSKITNVVDQLYKSLIGSDGDPSPLKLILVDHFGKWTNDVFADDLDIFFREKAFLVDRIKERAINSLLFRQSAILLVYWAISQVPRQVPFDGPLSDVELAPMYSDLGMRLPDMSM